MLKLLYTDVSKLGGKEVLHKAGQEILKSEVPDGEIAKNKNGKPYFTNHSLYFNISHSYPYVACAFSDCEAGIDVEKIRDVSKKAAERAFTESELDALKNGTDFLELWTAKESVIKAAGGSVPADCRKADVSSLSECDFNGKRYYLKRIDIPGCVCYIATACRQDNFEIIKKE